MLIGLQEGRRDQRTGARLVVTAAISAMLFLGACGVGSDTRSRTPGSGQNGTSAPATVTPSPSLPEDAQCPNLSRFTDAFDRFAYTSAYSACRLVGVDGGAEAFGGVRGDAASVARAYAVATFPNSEEHRDASFQGCLDAFETDAE